MLIQWASLNSFLSCIMFLVLHLATRQGSLKPACFHGSSDCFCPPCSTTAMLPATHSAVTPAQRTGLHKTSRTKYLFPCWSRGKGFLQALPSRLESNPGSWPRRGCQALSLCQHCLPLPGKKPQACAALLSPSCD